jgi:RNA-splicing ligase RtcB
MSNFQRLQRAFARNGIALDYRDGVYHLHNAASEARVLLPASLPLEEKAVRQLLAFAAVRSPHDEHGVCLACATPDFHPGSIAPVGSVVATDANFVIPAAIGTDINCGMRLLTTGLKLGQVAPHKETLIRRFTRSLLDNGRDVPVSTAAFRALFDAGPEAFLEAVRPEGLWASCDRERLHAEVTACVGLASFGGAARHAPVAYTGERHAVFRDPCLGTPGSGNHFVELQVVDVPHNVVLQEQGFNVHRKGATPAHAGEFALIPGSMGDASYLVTGLGHADWLHSCSHGAGRRMRRQEIRALRREAAGEQAWQCVTLREERRIEEAPQAYKPIGPVIDAQEEAGLIRAAVRLRPWVTFKA